MARPTAQQERFLIRLPDGMRDQISEIAKANGRSMNAEIIDRLEKSLAGDDGISDLKVHMEQFRLDGIDHDRRIDRLEVYVSQLRERAGLEDWNAD